MFKKILKPLKKYRKSLVFIAAALCVSTLLNLFIPVITRKMIDEGFWADDKVLVVKLSVLILALYCFNVFIKLWNEKKRIKMACDLRMTLSRQAFDKLLNLRIKYFDNNNYSELFSSINRDIGNLCKILDAGLLLAVTQLLSFIGGAVGLFLVGRELILLVVGFIPVKWIMVNYLAKKQRKLNGSYIEQERVYAKWFGNTLGGIREIRLFNIESGQREEFKHQQKKLLEKEQEMRWLDAVSGNGDMLLTQTLICLIYVIGTLAMTGLKLTVGSILAFVSYSVYVMNPIYMILNIKYMFSSILPSADRYYEFMEWDEEWDGGALGKAPSEFGIEFKNVCFGYEEGKSVLKNLNLHIREKEKVAVIGPNGSGKSTLMDLLLRLYDCENGSILFGGTDIREVRAGIYRRCFSIVSQDVFLFNGTVRDNIKLDAKIEDEKLAKVLKECDLPEFSDGPGLDYMVGENGSMLSGGQKQKIALARAAVRNSPVVILDEANSNLDGNAEAVIKKLIDTRWREKTVLFITHKRDILYLMDRIVLLRQGAIREEVDLRGVCDSVERETLIGKIGKDF